MKIIQPSFSLHTSSGELTEAKGVELLRWVEFNARISHRSEEAQTGDSWRRFIKAVVLEHGDYSVIEHASVTAILRVDRGVTHELVRHRLFSFTMESQRFINYRKKYPDGLEFIRPSNIPDAAKWNWEQGCANSEKEYLSMLDWGTRPQEARSVLPNACASTISVTGNLRTWRHLFIMRTTKETHPDFRAVTIPMLVQFQRLIPILYEDIQPDCRQIDNLSKPR